MRTAYALFDFDGTLIAGDSLVRFVLYARKRGLCSLKQLWRALGAGIRYGLNRISAEQSKMIALAFIQGHSEKELRELAEGFFQDVLRRRLRKKGLCALQERRQEGAALLLVTASPSFYLEPLKEALGFQEIIGTRMDFDQEGKATGFICGENCKGLQKPLRLAEYLAATGTRLEYAASYAYGDSPSDLPMLELCAHPIGVNAKGGLGKKLKQMEGGRLVRW